MPDLAGFSDLLSVLIGQKHIHWKSIERPFFYVPLCLILRQKCTASFFIRRTALQ
ncbi:MAG: hypothetical protein IPG51_18895 [Chloroflexi bacterium]|nr:hypothetical protein [Chloroflexota bacterium]